MISALQKRHEELLARRDALADDDIRRRTPAAGQLYNDAQQFISDVVAQSGAVSAPAERDLLRAYLRYWATFIYDWSGVFPKTDLRPAEQGVTGAAVDSGTQTHSGTGATTMAAPTPRRALPGWLMLLGGLLGVLLLAALAASFLFTRGFDVGGEVVNPDFPDPATPLPPITRTPLPETGAPAAAIDQSNAAQVQALAQADAHTGGARAVAFDPQKPELATSGADGDVRFWAWSAPDLTLSRRLAVGGGSVNVVDYSPTGGRSLLPGTLFLTGGNNRILSVYDAESLQLFADFVPASPESGFVFAGRFSPDGTLIASGHADGVTRIWSVTTGIESGNSAGGVTIQDRQAQIRPGGTGVRDVSFSPDGLYLAQALSGTDLGVQIVDRSWSNPVCVVRSGPASAVAYSPRDDLLAAGTERGELLLFSPGECDDDGDLYRVAAHEGGLTDLAFSPTGDWLVSSGRDGTMKVWTPDGQMLATLNAGAPVFAVAVAPEARYIASTDADGRLILWGIP